MQQQITPSTVEELAGLAGLPLDASRRPMLAAVLQQLIDGVRAMDALELEPIEPALVFNARWEE
jgi:Asp-tRNA(Asn)/Glu-tRNA(Gln) amidotransferase C subunit